MRTKQPTIDDLYMFDSYISTPGVMDGLLSRAGTGDPEVTIDETPDGPMAFYTAPHGERYVLGKPIQVAAAPTETMTDAVMMTLPEDAKDMSLVQFGKVAADVPAGLLKGAVQGTVGLPGDIIMLGRGIYSAMNPNPGEGRLDAFLRGTEGKTILPTTDDVQKFLDETLGVPLLPASDQDPVRRQAAGVSEFVGELAGGSKTAIELGKTTAKAAKTAKKTTAAAVTTPAMAGDKEQK